MTPGTVAFLLGAQMAGAVGALVSIPIAAIISSFFFYYLERYRERHGLVPVDVAPGPGGPPDGAAQATEPAS
jgi:amino acid permease